MSKDIHFEQLPIATEEEKQAAWFAARNLARRPFLLRLAQSSFNYWKGIIWNTPMKDWGPALRLFYPTVKFVVKGQKLALTCESMEEFELKLRNYLSTF